MKAEVDAVLDGMPGMPFAAGARGFAEASRGFAFSLAYEHMQMHKADELHTAYMVCHA